MDYREIELVAGCAIFCLVLLVILVLLRNRRALCSLCCGLEGDQENLIIDDEYPDEGWLTFPESISTIVVETGNHSRSLSQPNDVGHGNSRPLYPVKASGCENRNRPQSTRPAHFSRSKVNESPQTRDLPSYPRASQISYSYDYKVYAENIRPSSNTTLNPAPWTRASTPHRQRLPVAKLRSNSGPRGHHPKLKLVQPLPSIAGKPRGLIIAVDATPYFIGGYCVNPFEGVVQYYSVPSSRMPWVMNTSGRPTGNSAEFEMKNLLCSLLIWEGAIVRYKFVSVYTDNNAITGRKSKYARRVHNFLRHLQCEGVVVENPGGMYLNSKTDQESFYKLITPADHLSRRREDEFLALLSQSPWGKERLQKINFAMMNRSVLKWTRQECRKCGFCIERRGSLKTVPIFTKSLKQRI